MTREYCEKCPGFDKAKGYLESDNPYWQTHDDSCICKDCLGRSDCEAFGPNIDECLLRYYPEETVIRVKPKVVVAING